MRRMTVRKSCHGVCWELLFTSDHLLQALIERLNYVRRVDGLTDRSWKTEERE